MKFLTRKGYLIEEQGMNYLTDTDPDLALGPLQAPACTYRIALGPVELANRSHTRSAYHYILRNLWVRKLTTLLTAGGMALVVFVFAAVLMLSEGLKASLVSSFFFFF